MPRPLPLVLGVLLLLGFGLKLDRALTQPLAPQAAATGKLARGLADSGWHPIGESALLADGSLTAQAFRRGGCGLEVALLPPGPEHLGVLRAAWGDRARFLDEAGFSATPREDGRWRQLAQHLGHALGLGPRPALFGLAATAEGQCPVRLWEELAALRPG